MRDERLQKLARVLVDYSIEAGEGDQVLLSGGTAAAPLIREVYGRLLEAGSTPVPQIALPGMRETFFEHAKDIHYEKTPSAVRGLYEEVDAFISIMAPENTRSLANGPCPALCPGSACRACRAPAVWRGPRWPESGCFPEP